MSVCIYELPEQKPKDAVIIDLGCYKGFESQKLIDIYNPSLMISVDAVQEVIDMVNEKCKDNPKWTTDCCVVSDKSGVEEIAMVRSRCLGNQLCAGQFVGQDRVLTRVLPAKKIVEIHPNPNIIKCDIEAGEWRLWEQFLTISSLQIIFLELHGLAKINFIEKMNQLKKVYNVRFFGYSQRQSPAKDYTNEIQQEEYTCTDGSYCHVLAERRV